MNQWLRDTGELGRFAFHLLIAPWPPFAVFLVISAVIGGATPLLQIRVISGLIDALTAHAARTPAAGEVSVVAALGPYFPWLVLLIGLRIVDGVMTTNSFQQYLAAQLNERVRERFDGMFFGKALSLRLEWFESAAYFDALQRARRAMEGGTVADLLTGVQRYFAVALGCVGILWALAQVYWWIALLLLAGSLALVAAQLHGEEAMIEARDAQTRRQRRRDYWRRLVTERGPAAEVRLFGLGDHFVAAWRGLTLRMLDEMARVRRRSVRRRNRVLAGNTGIYGIVVFGLVIAAARGRVSPGTLVALLYVVHDYPIDIHNLSWWTGRFRRFFAELGHVPRFLSLEREEPLEGLAAPAILRDGIRFEKVSFTYPGGHRPALCEVDLHLRPGERIALVGENGAGKSTMVRLLLGLYQPTAGRITVDGVDLQAIAPSSWRNRVGAVLQDYERYSLTARENIGFGRLEKLQDRGAIEGAARRSSAAEVIESLPHGYETVLGKEFEGGHDLSQGQWQKLAIARAYLRDAGLLVLDEPASALDALAELAVYRQFLHLAEGRTVLLISHRLGSARLADRIVFLQEGRIAQDGTHDALVASGGPYAELYRMQAEWYREPEERDAAAPAG